MKTTIGISGNGHDISKTYDALLKQADSVEDKLKDKELTDEDIQQISDTINEMNSPSMKLLEQAKEEADKEQKNESATARVVINPIDGKPMMVDEMEDDDEFHLQSFEEMMLDDNIKPMDIDIANITIDKEAVSSIVNSVLGNEILTVEEFDQIIKAADRYKKGEKFPFFLSMPKKIQDSINRLIGASMNSKMGNFAKEGRNYIASELLREIVTSSATSVAVYDLEKAIKLTQKQASDEMRKDSYWRGSREFFMKTIPLMIDKETDPEKIETLEKIKKAFTESYTYDEMLSMYKLGKLKVKKIQIEKFDKTCTGFNLKYQRSSNIITEISTILASLDRNAAKHFDIDILKEFICVFINYTKNMNPNDKIDHIFMYYFIYNINTLDFYDKSNEEDVAFRDELVNNVNKFLNAIVDYHNNKKE